MAYETPTVEDFRARFPEFEADGYVPDEVIQRVLNEASRQVDSTWLEADYAAAILYLAAHLLTVSTFAEDSVGQENIKSLSIGPLSIAYGEQVSFDKLSSTSYGQQFSELRRVNVPAVLVI